MRCCHFGMTIPCVSKTHVYLATMFIHILLKTAPRRVKRCSRRMSSHRSLFSLERDRSPYFGIERSRSRSLERDRPALPPAPGPIGPSTRQPMAPAVPIRRMARRRTGPTPPVGEARTDDERLERLERLIERQVQNRVMILRDLRQMRADAVGQWLQVLSEMRPMRDEIHFMRLEIDQMRMETRRLNSQVSRMYADLGRTPPNPMRLAGYGPLRTSD